MRLVLVFLVLLCVPVVFSFPDLTGSGVVGMQDLLFVLDRFGTNDSVADVNEDGVVDLFDLVLVARSYGQVVDSEFPDFLNLQSQEPPGFTLIHDVNWETIPFMVADNRHPGTHPEIAEDPTAPGDNFYVVRQTYAGVPDGQEPQFLYPFFGGAHDSLYYASFVKFDDTWVQPSFSGIKWHIPVTRSGTWIGWIGLGDSPSEPGSPKLGFVLDNSATYGGRLGYETLDVPLTPGEWHKIQYLIENVPLQQDRIRMWVNDILVLDSNDAPPWTEGGNPIQQSGPLEFIEDKQMTGIQMGATWGGGIPYPGPEGNTLSYAHTYMSGIRTLD